MKRITYLAAAGALAATSGLGAWAANGATGDTHAAHVRTTTRHGADDPAGHHRRHDGARDRIGQHPAAATQEPGDDNDGVTNAPEPGDDNGGVTNTPEPGDDNGGVTNAPEPGDDNGGDHDGGSSSGSDDGGHHGGSDDHGSDD